MPEEIQADLFYVGNYLHKAVFETPDERKFLINGLIPEHSITMFYAPDGHGKSTVLLQAGLESASGQAVFGGLSVERPLKIFYIMAERHRYEAFERIKLMSNFIELIWENFLLTDKLQGYNLLQEKDFKSFIEKILYISKGAWPQNPDLIIIDPIYALIPKGLVSEEGSGAINNLCRRLQSELHCAITYSHHANRGIKSENGERTGMDMYGSRFLSANCTGVFKIMKSPQGTNFTCEKDSLSCLIKKISLQYNPECHSSLMDPKQMTTTKIEKFKQYVNNCFTLQKTISFADLESETALFHSNIRQQVAQQVKAGVLINLKPKGTIGLYKVLKKM